MSITAQFATKTQRVQHGTRTALHADPVARGRPTTQPTPLLRSAWSLAAIALVSLGAAGSCVAQDGLSMLPPEAREAGTAYRKMMAAENNGSKNSAAERSNYEVGEAPKSRCSEATRQFCSDLANAQFEFKPFKALLPDVPRLTPHNVYIRRNKITVAYTFK